MARKFLVNLDMNKNQILNLVLQTLASHPGTPVNGQIYYNSTDSKPYYYNGSVWTEFGGGGNNLSADGTSIQIVGDVISIVDGGVTEGKLATNAVTTIKIADSNITFQKIQNVATMTVIGRVAGGTGAVSEVPIITDLGSGADNSNLATAGAIKSYVDGVVAGLGNLEGSFDANLATDFPVGASGTKKGDYWFVTAAGTIHGVELNIGDVIIAKIDAAGVTVAADWIVLESNRSQATTSILGVVQLATNAEVQAGTDTNKAITPSSLSSRTATEERAGLAEIATQGETNTGTDDERIVTPLKLKTYLDARVGGYAANVGNGTNTSFTLTHNLGTKDIVVSVYEIATDTEVVADVVTSSTSQITVSFSVAPTTDQYRVVIKK